MRDEEVHMRARSAYLSGPHNLELRDVDLPEIHGQLVLVMIKASGICGSDVECYTGRSKEGRYDIAPYVPGHEWSGEVVEVGRDVVHMKKGDRVTGDCVLPCGNCYNCKSNLSTAACLNMREAGFMPNAPGGMGEYLVLEERFLHKFPEEMTYEEGALVEPFSVSYFAIWGRGGHVDASDDVVVFGAGPIGLSAAVIAKTAGANVILVEPIEFRRKIAQNFGVDTVVDPNADDLRQSILEITTGRGADLVVEASGSDSAISSLFDVAGHNARIRLIGHSIGRKTPLDVGVIIWKSLTVTGQAGSPYAFPKTIRFIKRIREEIDLSQIITKTFPLEEIKAAFEYAVKEKEKAVKVMVLP